jgi:hypothetical protein
VKNKTKKKIPCLASGARVVASDHGGKMTQVAACCALFQSREQVWKCAFCASVQYVGMAREVFVVFMELD